MHMKKMAQGVLWDMDGVLVDTGEAHFLSWKSALAEFDKSITRESFQATFGMNNDGVLKTLFGQFLEPELVADIGERKELLFRQAVKGNVQLLPGVQDWLHKLKKWGVKQAIASSAPMANIDVLLDEVGIRTDFEAIVSGWSLPGKPDPAVFLEAARQIGIQPGRCVVIEDAMAGVQGARNAGMKCIAVTTTNDTGALREANIVVDSLVELTEESFSVS
jgi:beta-phosphoglucomutase family hydrolase